VEGLERRALLSIQTVSTTADSGPGSLRDKIAHSAPGDVIRFLPSLDGKTITLTSGEIDPKVSLTIKGPGEDKLTISGDKTSSIFGFGVAGATFTVSDLTFRDGKGYRGGAIHDDATGGQLNVMNCTFADDSAVVAGGTLDAQGGAIASHAPLTVTDCDFSSDLAAHPPAAGPVIGGGGAYGGAIYCDAPSLNVADSHFDHCAAGSNPTYNQDGPAYGGAVAWAPSLDGSSGVAPTGYITSDFFTRDYANSTALDLHGAAPVGGGAVNVSAGTTRELRLTISDCNFQSDLVEGASSVVGGLAEGASVRLDASAAFVPNFQLHDNTYLDGRAYGGDGLQVGAGTARGGEGRGAAVAALADRATSPTFTIRNDQVLDCYANGGSIEYGNPTIAPPQGGDARGGGLYLDAGFGSGAQFNVFGTMMSDDRADGGGGGGAYVNGAFPGTFGGNALGGGLDAFANDASKPSFNLVACIFVYCRANGGDGGVASGASKATPAVSGSRGGDGIGGGVVFDAGTASSAAFVALGSFFGSDVAHGGRGGYGGSGGSLGNGAAGGKGGSGSGGGLAVCQTFDRTNNGVGEPFSATVQFCSFWDDHATGGTGGFGGDGVFGGDGGTGGDAAGGGIWDYCPYADHSDVLTFNFDTLLRDQAKGGIGGTGGHGDVFDGGNGGHGGDARGGGILTEFAGTVKLLVPMVTGCSALDGPGGAGGTGTEFNGLIGKSGKGYGGGISAYSYLVGGKDLATAQRVISGNTAAVSPEIDGNLGTL
jgi:hypothetical protein